MRILTSVAASLVLSAITAVITTVLVFSEMNRVTAGYAVENARSFARIVTVSTEEGTRQLAAGAVSLNIAYLRGTQVAVEKLDGSTAISLCILAARRSDYLHAIKSEAERMAVDSYLEQAQRVLQDGSQMSASFARLHVCKQPL